MPRRPSALVRPDRPQRTRPGRAQALLLEGGRRGVVRGESSGPGLQVRGPLWDEPSCLGPDWSCRRHPRPPALDRMSGGLAPQRAGLSLTSWLYSIPRPRAHRGGGRLEGRRLPTHREGPGDSACPVVGTVTSVRFLCPGGEGPILSLAQVTQQDVSDAAPQTQLVFPGAQPPAPLLTAVPWTPGPSPPCRLLSAHSSQTPSCSPADPAPSLPGRLQTKQLRTTLRPWGRLPA